MRNLLILGLIGLIVSTQITFGQAKTKALDAAEKELVIDSVTQILNRDYVFPGT